MVDLENTEYENIIIKTINSILSIIYNNYIYHKHILLNIKKYKTLFRILYDILKIKKNNIINNIFQPLYGITFNLKKQLNGIILDINLLEQEKIIQSFSDGLMGIIFDAELYMNYKGNNSINMLLDLSNKILKEYNDSTVPNRIFPFEQGFLFKILKFIKIFEHEFTSDLNNNANIINNYFQFILYYLKSINKHAKELNYLSQLFIFVVKNYRNNLFVIKLFSFILEVLSNEFYLEQKEIKLFLYFISEYKVDDTENKEEKNVQLINDINKIIYNILIKLLLIDNSKEILPEFLLKLENLENSDIIISIIISELNKYLEQKMKSNNDIDNGNNSKLDYMKLYRNIFNFIFDLFKLLIKKNKNIYQGEKSDKLNNTNELDNYKKLINILNFICELLNLKQKNIEKIYIEYIVLLIFYYFSIK